MWWALFLGLGLLLLVIGGIIAAVAYFQPNVASLTIRNTDKEPISFELRVTGVALLCGLALVLCLSLALRFLSRIMVLQDREMRWLYLGDHLEALPAEEARRMIEGEPLRETSSESSSRRPYQLRLVWPHRSEKTGHEKDSGKD